MHVHGPQLDRKVSRLGPVYSRDAGFAPQEAKAFDNENQRLRKDIKLVQTQLNRCMSELKFYQSHSNATYRQTGEINEDLPPWTLREDVMEPLYEAYDQRIKELEGFIDIKKNELSLCQEKLHEILTENEQLRKLHYESLHNNSSAVGSGGARSGDRLDASLPMLNEIISEMQERIDVLMSENSILVDQKHHLAMELEKHHVELTAKHSDFENVIAVNNTLKSDLSKFENQIKQAVMERDEAAKQALKFSDALSSIDSLNEKIQLQLRVTEKKLQEKDNLYAQMQSQFEAAIKEHSGETLNQSRKMKIVDDRNQELFQSLNMKNQECDELQDSLRKLKREYQSTRTDAEGMIQVMSGLERQLSDYAAKEDDLDRLVKDLKSRTEDAIIERDQLKVREEYYQRELQRLSNEKVDLVKDNEVQLEKKTFLLQKLSQDQILKMEKDINKMAEIVASLRFENENLARERNSIKDQFDQISRKHRDHYEQTQEAVDNLKLKLDSTERICNGEAMKRNDYQQENTNLKSTIGRLQHQIEDLMEKLVTSERNKNFSFDQIKLQNKSLELDVVELQRSTTALTEKLQTSEQDLRSYREVMSRRHEEEVSKLKRELDDRTKMIDDFNESILQVCPDNAIKQIKDKYSFELLRYQTQAQDDMSRMKDEIVYYKAQYNDLIQLLKQKDVEISHLDTELKAFYETELHN
jgi:chromosome segregation ATPase